MEQIKKYKIGEKLWVNPMDSNDYTVEIKDIQQWEVLAIEDYPPDPDIIQLQLKSENGNIEWRLISNDGCFETKEEVLLDIIEQLNSRSYEAYHYSNY